MAAISPGEKTPDDAYISDHQQSPAPSRALSHTPTPLVVNDAAKLKQGEAINKMRKRR